MQSHIKISGEKLGNKSTPRRVLSLWFKNNKTKQKQQPTPQIKKQYLFVYSKCKTVKIIIGSYMIIR